MRVRRGLNLLVDVAPASEFERQIVRGASQYCQEHPGYRLRTASSETHFLDDADVIDGVIAMVKNDQAQRSASRFGKPVVNVSAVWEDVPFPTVIADNRSIGRIAAEHLLQQGYRSFACHIESRAYFSRERQLGFSEVLEAAGHLCSVFDTGGHDNASASQQHALTVAWLRELPKPLGLFTHNDLRAIALMDVCHDARLNIPDEVGIIGVDNDVLLAQLATPNLTSIETGATLIGHVAADTLSRIILAQIFPKSRILVPAKEVVARESTDPKHLMDDRLKAALGYIRKRATTALSVEDVLSAVPASRRSLERLFRDNLGHSPAQEIRRIRLNHAKWLLVEGDRPLSQIAQHCGYSTFHNFATAFRREVGLSASVYRKQFRKR